MIRTSLVAAVLLAALPAHQAAAQKYTFVTIKDGKGMMTSMHDINASNTSVGGVFATLSGVRNCFVMKGKKKTPLSDPNAVNGTECWGISSTGTIVGDYVDANSAYHGYIYSNGTFSDIAPPKSMYTVVYGVNASNVAIGYYIDTKGVYYGFLYDGTKFTKLTVKGGTTTEGFGIDDAGDYTLTSVLSDGYTHSYYVPHGGKRTEILFPNYEQTVLHHMNNSGQISATIIDTSGNYHCGVYDSVKNLYYTLDDKKGTITIGDGINDKQTVVGRYQTAESVSYGYVATGKLQ
jgi:hypothetical protein